MRKLLNYIWRKSDGKKSVIFNSLAAYLQYMVSEDIFPDVKWINWLIKTLLFLGTLSLGHKGKKVYDKLKTNKNGKTRH